MRRLTTLYLALATVACNTTPQHTAEENTESSSTNIAEEVVDRDSLIAVLDTRYNQLCEERKRAYNEVDSARRATLLEANDRASQELSDSLCWIIKQR